MRTFRRTATAASSIAALTTAFVVAVGGPASAEPTPCSDLEPIAHRGFHPTGLDENTLAAFQSAAEHGYSVETDVWQDSEGVFWMFHDLSTLRSTGVEGHIEDMTTAQVSELRYTKAGSPLTTLSDAMDYFATQPDLRVYIELKRTKPTYAQGVAQEIRDAGRVDNTWVTSAIFTMQQEAPDIRLLLKASNLPSPDEVRQRGASIVSLPDPDLTTYNVAMYQSAGLEVQSRHGNTTDEWRRTIRSGADGQLTDDPDQLLAYCPEVQPHPRIRKVTPRRAPRGSEITILGRRLDDATRVRFGRRLASFTVESGSEITAVVPKPLARTTYVYVRTPDGLARSAREFVAVRPRGR